MRTYGAEIRAAARNAPPFFVGPDLFAIAACE